ncbi:P-type conjugative transfer protein TrbL [Pseudomonas fragi]|uniref:P-type conjugative transfer protein TrbL n=1 Tax=Pseudomonas fragi TaxID=296 RepID=A0A9Q5FQU2_PSEFR|nr:P-type conjugative transfer protein TrbL [Pseudomonas fragi]NNB50438.1 P-type conjugative transfer protein TrbL [Pseudomonas fragi]
MDRRLLLFLTLASVFFAGDAMAATDLAHPDTSVQSLLDLILQRSGQWSGRLHSYAVNLLLLLAGIQLVWTFVPMALRGADFGEIFHELIKFVMMVGFFLAMIQYSVEWATAIVDSFRDAGAVAGGFDRTLEPGDMFAVAVDFSRSMVTGISLFSPGKAILIAIAALVVLLCFAFIAAFMFVTLVESYVIINAAMIFLGFGGSQWTREYAIAPIRYTVAVGAKLFVLSLIVGLIVSSAHDWSAAYTNDEASLMTLVGLALVCCYLTKTIPELIGGMISGTSMGGGSTIGGMAAAGAAGAATAIATVATAGAAAPAAAGALGGGGAGAAVGAGSGGLASALNASIAGGSGAGATGGAAMGAGSVGISASTGGGSAAAKAAGSRVGGGDASGASGSAPSAGTQQSASNGVKQAVKQAGKATEGSDEDKGQQITAQQQTAPKGGVVSSGNALAQGAEVATRALGVLGAISVPGMEGSHSLSLGAGSPPPVPGDDSPTPERGSERPAESESNVIRPASDTTLTSLNVPGKASDTNTHSEK